MIIYQVVQKQQNYCLKQKKKVKDEKREEVKEDGK